MLGLGLAVAVVNPWIRVLVGVAPQQRCWGVVAVVNPWTLVLVGVAPQQGQRDHPLWDWKVDLLYKSCESKSKLNN